MNQTSEGKEKSKKPSILWVLVPIFLGVIGGIIGYYALKDRDEKFAKQILWVGIILTALWILINVLEILMMIKVGSMMQEAQEEVMEEAMRKIESQLCPIL